MSSTPASPNASTGGVAAANRPVTLPTGRLLAAVILPALTVGVAWVGLCLLAGWDRPRTLGGAVGAGWVALVGAATVAALTPWSPRKLAIWPLVWTAAGFVRMIVALGGGLLLYSRPDFGGAVVFAPVVAAYLAVMAFETREYARAMARHHPTDVPPPADGTFHPPSTHSSE